MNIFKLFVNGTQTIKTGDQTVFMSEKKVKVGTKVSIFSQMGQHLGTKPIAQGKVVSACKNETGAPVTPTRTGARKKNAWRNLYRVEVTKIEE